MEGHGMSAATKARGLLDAMMAKPKPPLDVATANPADGHHRRIESPSEDAIASLLTTYYYDVVLQAYAVSGAGTQAAAEAEALLNRMIQTCRAHQAAPVNQVGKGHGRHRRPPAPTTKTFNIVLNCWAKSDTPNAAERASAVFGLMEQWSLECAASGGYNACWADERTLVSVIEAWTHGRPRDAPEVALGLLQGAMFAADNRVAAKAGTSGNYSKFRNVQLDAAVFNAVVYAWVRSNRGRQAALRAEEVLQLLVQWHQVRNARSINCTAVKPTTRTYSMIVMAWAECEAREKEGDAARRAENILLKMVQLYRDGGNDVKPNSIPFTTCVAAWSRAAANCPEAPERAERLWDILDELYHETAQTDKDFEPQVEMGNAVMSAWSRCTTRVDSVERSLGVLEKLKQASLDNLISYNTVLDAMSKKGLGKDAMELLQHLEDVSKHRDSLTPNRVTYNTVLAALSRSKTADKCAAAEEAERLLRKMNTLDEPPSRGALAAKQRCLARTPDCRSYTCTLDKSSRLFLFVRCSFAE